MTFVNGVLVHVHYFFGTFSLNFGQFLTHIISRPVENCILI